MPDPSDRDLVRRTREGEQDAYGSLVRRYQSSVFSVCLRLLGHRREAEDLAQEAFIRGYQRLDSFDNERPFGPWIRRVAANLCYNHLKRHNPPSFPLLDELDTPLISTTDDPAQTQLQNEKIETLRQAILMLPPHYRAVIELRHYQELSYVEISETLQIPLSDVRSHLYRARKALSRRLKPDAIS